MARECNHGKREFVLFRRKTGKEKKRKTNELKKIREMMYATQKDRHV